MTFYVNAPNELAIATALQAWIMAMLPLDGNHVIQAHDNRVDMPTDPFIVISHLSRTPLSTPWSILNDTTVQATENEVVNLSIEYKYQLDCYGSQAADYIMVLHVLMRSDATSEWFAAYGLTNGLAIDTLYADDPTHTAIVNAEAQYEERWTLRMRLNVVEQVYMPINFMGAAIIKPMINVPVTYPR